MPDNENIDLKCINTIRTLSMDAVQAANSGHPGTPMALAPGDGHPRDPRRGGDRSVPGDGGYRAGW
jgi:Transketolase, thiamine diphosphate binding domain